MPFEVFILALSILLTALQFAVMAVAVNTDRRVGPRWTMGARDEPRTYGRFAGRMKRAFENQLEGLLLFTAAVTVVALSGQSTAFTGLMATIYLVARLLYVPAYAFHVWGVRSTVWAVGFVATLAMPVAALLFTRAAT